MIKYKQFKRLDKNYIKDKITSFLKEDIPVRDVTTAGTVEISSNSIAYIQAQQDLVFSGEEIIPVFFENDERIDSVKVLKKDGDSVKNGEKIAVIQGNSGVILSKERVLLNLLQRLCAITTVANNYAKIANKYGVKVLDTRKTTPGLRMFEKYAVACGGGTNHRFDLSSGVLIKDNHIAAAGSIENAVKKIKSMDFELPVEIETENKEQIKEALAAGVDGFLLDNMKPVKTAECVELIRSYKNGNDIFIEASGGINLDTLESYCKTGVNAVSIGALTHSVKSADIHIEFE